MNKIRLGVKTYDEIIKKKKWSCPTCNVEVEKPYEHYLGHCKDPLQKILNNVPLDTEQTNEDLGVTQLLDHDQDEEINTSIIIEALTQNFSDIEIQHLLIQNPPPS